MRRPLVTPMRVVALLAVLVLGAGVLLAVGTRGHERTPPPVAGPTGAFPRTAVYWLSQDELPPATELAGYDVVVVDNEWAHRDPEKLRELRHIAPGVRLLAYVNLVDRNVRLGSPSYYANRFALWKFSDSTTSTFPDAWLARTAVGDPVSQWPDTLMTNLSDTGPTVDGVRFPDYAARWVIDQVWSTRMWDGVFLDVWGDQIFGATHDAWDVDGDGVDEPADRIYSSHGPWARGLTEVESTLRAALPSSAILIGNGERTMSGDRLDGRAYESFADPGSDRDPATDLASYLDTTSAPGQREPGMTMTINKRRALPGSSAGYRNARFQLTGTLLSDGYWAPMGGDYGELAYYDEMDGGGIGRGYLGSPGVPAPTPQQVHAAYRGGIGEVAPGVTRRDFQHGIVLRNNGSDDQTVSLGGEFQRIRGEQDPSVDDGAVVTVVRVPAGDGLILLRTGPEAPPRPAAG